MPFWTKIRTKNQDGTLGNILPVGPSKAHIFIKNNHKYVWYQDNIYLAIHRLVRPFQLGATGIKKLKYLNMIEEKRWKKLVKREIKRGHHSSNSKELVPLGK